MKQFIILLFAFSFIACQNNSKQKENTSTSQKTQNSKVVDRKQKDDPFSVYEFDDFQKLFLNKKDGKVHVINFWATFCAPCLKEMPYFYQLNKETDAEVLMVSLDMGMMMDSDLKPYLEKHPVEAKLIVLDDPESNKWIPKVNPNWNSSIPATLIYKDDESKFYDKPFRNYKELLTAVKQFD